MSQEDVEFVHRAIDAFNRQDLSALADFCADDFEFVSMLTAVEAGGSTYRGRDAWGDYFAAMRDAWAEWRVDDFEVFDAGEGSLVAVVRVAGRGHSGVAVERTIGMTYRLREGELSHMRAYLDPQEAREAVGLSGMGEPFAGAVRWPVDSGAIRLRMSDRLVARLPGVMRRAMTRFLVEPAGSRTRRWIIDRGLLAGFAATDASDWDWLSRVYEPDVVVRVADDALPGLPSRTDGFAALRTMIDTSRDVLQAFDSRPVEIVDLGGRHFAAVVEHDVAGAYSAITISGQFIYLYEMSDSGRIARQWWTADPATAEAFHRERLGELQP